MKNEEYGTYEQSEAQPKEKAAVYKRVPVSRAPRAVSLHLLTNPKMSLNRRERKVLHSSRGVKLVLLEPLILVAQPVKFARRLMHLKLTQLVRRQKKYARLSSTAKHVIAKMSPGFSRLRSAVEEQQRVSLGFFRQVTAEIKARALACEGRLADADELHKDDGRTGPSC